jgi:hypothetical protein
VFWSKSQDCFKFGIYKAIRHQVLCGYGTESKTTGISLLRTLYASGLRLHVNTRSILFFISIN